MAAILRIGGPDMALVAKAKLVAARWIFDGRASPAAQRFLRHCRHYHQGTATVILFTRDTGHHSSGWWKNPDYERCYHLSLSFGEYDRDRTFYREPFNAKMAARWAEAFFGDNTSLLWIEPPYSDEGRAADVYHYRLFCDEAWQPLKPRGEVYSKDWTPAGWKSFSDIHGEAA